MILHQHPDNKSKSGPSSVKGHMRIYDRTGVDASATWIVDWKDVGTAVCTTSIDTQMNLDRCVTVQMEQGEMTIDCESGFDYYSSSSPRSGEFYLGFLLYVYYQSLRIDQKGSPSSPNLLPGTTSIPKRGIRLIPLNLKRSISITLFPRPLEGV
jgi:hypothetical protein